MYLDCNSIFALHVLYVCVCTVCMYVCMYVLYVYVCMYVCVCHLSAGGFELFACAARKQYACVHRQSWIRGRYVEEVRVKLRVCMHVCTMYVCMYSLF